MNNVLHLKSAAIILFWFGVIAEFFILAGAALEYNQTSTFQGMSFDYIFLEWHVGTLFLTYTLFVHCVHISAGYFLSKGLKIGLILGISVGLYEIIAFLVPQINYEAWTLPVGIAIRIIFIITLFLIIIGKKDLIKLQSENWRPWKNPRIATVQNQP